MELDEPQALVHLLWLGASVDKEIADSEREYIQKVCSHEKIPLKLEELEKHHENNQFDQIYQECVFTFKELPLDDRLKAWFIFLKCCFPMNFFWMKKIIFSGKYLEILIFLKNNSVMLLQCF